MIPLQQNIDTLKEAFLLCHNKRCQKALDNYQLALLSTNEINGMEYRCDGITNYIVPLFIEGQDSTEILRQISDRYQKAVLSATSTSRPSKLFNVRNYWSSDHFSTLYELVTFDDPEEIIEDASIVARSLLKYSPPNMTMVCGPISSILDGPSRESNLEVFHLTMWKLAEEGRNVFNQLPFEPAFKRAEELLTTTHSHLLENRTPSEYFIEHFYKKIIMIEKHWNPCFIFGSERSVGSELIRTLFIRQNYEPEFLAKGYHRRVA